MRSAVPIGLLAGAIVALISIAFIAGAWDLIEQRALDAEYETDGDIDAWMIRWADISIMVGIAASLVYSFAAPRWRWANAHHLIKSALIMAVLDLLAFLPIYDSSVHIYPAVYLGLNAIFCMGLGFLIPALSSMSHRGRPAA